MNTTKTNYAEGGDRSMKNKKYVLGKKKLTDRQFAKKYSMHVEKSNYQFHTMDIEDGLDERQQLLINNDRALYELIKECHTNDGKTIRNSVDIYRIKKDMRRLLISQLLIIGYFISKCQLQFLKKKK